MKDTRITDGNRSYIMRRAILKKIIKSSQFDDEEDFKPW